MMKNITFSASFFRELFWFVVMAGSWFVVMAGSWFVVWYMPGLLQHYY
ncbi:hypothetical protein KJ370_003210 [Salmonella enterica]|nr:hypothetical protein [Salmonella enterica]EHN8547525.1 hypothetical protein [Salmonella enterica]ELX7143937.1 hypothetical protein [Salmonella enterica]